MVSLKSSSKSIKEYFLPALIWNTDKLFIHDTNLVKVVLPTPLAPTKSK